MPTTLRTPFLLGAMTIARLAVLGLAGVAAGDDFYVAPNGNDANAGSIGDPWRTIQKAADTLLPGDTVFVRAGTYAERITVNVSGTAGDGGGGTVTFRNFAGETPVIDGTTLTVPDTLNGLFYLEDRSYVTIDGFELRDYRTNIQHRVPVGIHVRGAGTNVTIRNCTIHRIETNFGGVDGGDAHGIGVFGTSMTPITNLVIEHNELYDLVLGSSEALVVNGNVDGFTIASNHVHDCNNIAIDCIGFEGMAPDPLVDQARHGAIHENRIADIDTLGNPAYPGERSAGGIYIDGGRDILVERNEIIRANIGIELASEMAGRSTSGVTVVSNLVRGCHVAGLAMGGYDEFRGRTEDCTVVNNTFFRNDTDETYCGELFIQFDTEDCVLRNNIVVAGAQNVLITNAFVENTNNVFDDNLYFAPGGAGAAEFVWKGVFYPSYAAYQVGTGNDPNTIFTSPSFVAPNADPPDLHLMVTSPAVDAGVDAAVPPASTLDLDGLARIQGASVDLGGYEWPSTAPCPTDLDGDGTTGFSDVLQVIGAWGPCVSCPEDLDASGSVGFSDLLTVIGAWGTCP